MISKSIYVLHEFGAPSHYLALEALGRKNNFKVKYRIFNPKFIIKLFFKGQIKKALNSFFFLLFLPIRKKSKIVIGIAPFNWLLIPLSFLLFKHKVYLHTSYTCWDGSFMAYKPKTKKLVTYWRYWINNKVNHIFAVSNKTKEELIKNKFSISAKISVVNHSFEKKILYKEKEKDNSFLYVGRLIEEKGIPELMNIFEKNKDLSITIIGDGKLRNLVEEYSRKNPNIKYMGYVKGFESLITYYQNSSFFILNSKKTDEWEELFGMVLIEAMACGCVPIAVNHSGPKEIINDTIDGFLTNEGNIENLIEFASNISSKRYKEIRNNTVSKGKLFQDEIIAYKWFPILKK